MTQKVKIHALGNDNEYFKIHPETVASQVILDELTGETLQSFVERMNNIDPEEPFYRTVTNKFTVTATIDNQTIFNFGDTGFSKETDSTIIFLQSEPLEEDVEYVVSETLPEIILTEGAPIGTKLHIIVLRDAPVTKQELYEAAINNPQQFLEQSIPQTKIQKVFDGEVIYHIDSVNGLDSNIGTSVATPLKSLEKLSTLLSDTKTLNNGVIKVFFKPGVYSGLLKIINFDKVFLNTYEDETEYAVFEELGQTSAIQYSSIHAEHGHHLAITGNFKFTPVLNTGTYLKTLLVNKVRYTSLTRVLFDNAMVDPVIEAGSACTSIRIDYGSLIISNCIFNNVTRPVHSDGGNIVDSATVYTNCGDRMINYGGTYTNLGSYDINPKVPGAPRMTGSGLDFTDIKNRIIQETGENANGRYIKFANGDIIMNYFATSVSLNDLRDEDGTPLSNHINTRFKLRLPHDVVTITGATLDGFATNAGHWLFKHIRIAMGTVAKTDIYGFILDDSNVSGFDSNVTHVNNLSFIVTGKWK